MRWNGNDLEGRQRRSEVTVPIFTLKDSGKPVRSPVRLYGIPFQIWTKHLSNTSLHCHRYAKFDDLGCEDSWCSCICSLIGWSWNEIQTLNAFPASNSQFSARRNGRHELMLFSRIFLSFWRENDKELKKTGLMMIMICCWRLARALPPTAEVRDTSYVIPAAITKHCVIIDLSKCHALMTSTVRIPLVHR
jgi:hypothetical protein